jgi:lipopolysaccharide export system protein LptC
MSGGGTSTGSPRLRVASDETRRAIAAARSRHAPTPARIARRRLLITWSKRLLPALALVLLSSIALWPEIARQTAAGRAALRGWSASITASGQMIDARYHGVDEKNRPYTLTASTATQATPERVNLTDPKGDVQMESGNWLMLSAKRGVYMQHLNQLDLEGNVVLYRDDGTTLHSATASLDLRAGAGASNDITNAEGPFGTLDAMGFALVDKGAVIQFVGPARLVLNNNRGDAHGQPQ